LERINALRQRHEQLSSSISHYEERVAEQTLQLDRMNRPHSYDDDYFNGESEHDDIQPPTSDDLKREEQEVKDLEAKKRGLEDRVSGIEKDLGGLLR
jgi:chromosome segregation ATPase